MVWCVSLNRCSVQAPSAERRAPSAKRVSERGARALCLLLWVWNAELLWVWNAERRHR